MMPCQVVDKFHQPTISPHWCITNVLALFCLVVSALSVGGCAHRKPFSGRVAETGIYSDGREVGQFAGGYTRFSQPRFLSYEELVALSETGHPGSDTPLGQKVDELLTTPIIDNRAWFSGERPARNTSSKLGPVLRCATWNIEKSLRMPEVIAAMTSEQAYVEMIDAEKIMAGSETLHEMLRQRERLVSSDILFLQEMDIGVNRSGYANAAGDLAKAMGMNYAYATQAIEVDPVLLGLELITKHETGEIDMAATDYFRADSARFKGCFGSAVLSRYPIKSVEIIPLETVGYNWYEDEKKKLTFIEDVRRVGTELLFENVSTREMKVGGRHLFRVDLDVPGAGPTNTLTVINVHLEIKCLPKQRVKQIKEILAAIGDIPNPVMLAGDFNAAPIDLSPTSVPRITWRLAKEPDTWLNVASEVIWDLDWASIIRNGVNFIKNLHSPLAPDIPLLLPNDVRPLIDEVEGFRFADGTAFDFRGDSNRSMGRWHGLLSNSNQKQLKGQVQSFSVKRPIGPIGYYCLDWMFMRSGLLQDPRDKRSSYQLAPHFGETLRAFSHYLERPFSDHRPLVVDLPLKEPHL